jgi:hypothetical protein
MLHMYMHTYICHHEHATAHIHMYIYIYVWLKACGIHMQYEEVQYTHHVYAGLLKPTYTSCVGLHAYTWLHTCNIYMYIYV